MTKQEQINDPVRMCIACRKRFPKKELTRYVRPDGASGQDAVPVHDPDQTKPGRGYYVCGQAHCRDRFPKMVMGLMKKRER